MEKIEKELSSKEAHKLFWETFNDKCISCIHKCKQSSKVFIMYCPEFKKLENQDEK